MLDIYSKNLHSGAAAKGRPSAFSDPHLGSPNPYFPLAILGCAPKSFNEVHEKGRGDDPSTNVYRAHVDRHRSKRSLALDLSEL